jgi:hypothetical protein
MCDLFAVITGRLNITRTPSFMIHGIFAYDALMTALAWHVRLLIME